VDDAVYDSQVLRNFVGIDLNPVSVPDATTLMGFRHLLEAHDVVVKSSTNTWRNADGMVKVDLFCVSVSAGKPERPETCKLMAGMRET